MNKEQFLKNLQVPTTKVDVILDTDAYNEIDDQYAISYLLKSSDKLNTIGLVAAPFLNEKSVSAGDGMEKSYREIKNVIELGGFNKSIPVFRGSTDFLKDEVTPIYSEGVDFIINKALLYSPKNPLYVVAIGAITNVASALLINPAIKENIVIVWLGGHSREYKDSAEFNLIHDVYASRVVMGSGAPFIQLPCLGVVSELRVSEQDLKFWLYGKNKLSDYLGRITVRDASVYASGKPWTRVIWDVAPIAFLLNDTGRFMQSRIVNVRLSDLNGNLEENELDIPMNYVYFLNRDLIIEDLFNKLLK